MPIQSEQVVFPHVVPGPPDTEADLLDWAKDTATSLQELTRQMVDKYNRHIVGTHAHPAAWANMRVSRPGFEANLSDLSQAIVVATADKPVYFVVDGEVFEVTSNLTLDLDTAGAGGLRTGLTKASDTGYYLYAVRDSGANSVNGIALLGDTNAPSTGPTGYSVWTYLGALATEIGSASFRGFKSANGIIHFDEHIEEQTSTSVILESETFSSLPDTAKTAYFYLAASGGAVGNLVRANGVNDTDDNALITDSTGTAQISITHGWIPIFTAQTVYVRTQSAAVTLTLRLLGWREDPTEYP